MLRKRRGKKKKGMLLFIERSEEIQDTESPTPSHEEKRGKKGERKGGYFFWSRPKIVIGSRVWPAISLEEEEEEGVVDWGVSRGAQEAGAAEDF